LICRGFGILIGRPAAWHNPVLQVITVSELRPPLPPFTRDFAILKVRAAEDGWNSCDPARGSLAYSADSGWRRAREGEYRLIKEVWAFGERHIAVRFAYESHDAGGQWFRSYGKENWEFDDAGLMRACHASINDLPIRREERLFPWDRTGPRPAGHARLTELGL
jgi:nuclear transport factor 2 (NTF2) superfamily protein